MKPFALAALALVSFGAVVRAEVPDFYAALTGTTWRATEIAGQPSAAPTRPTLTFGPNRRISGAGGCNHYDARYWPDMSDPHRRTVTIHMGSWTKMLCRDGREKIDFSLGEALKRTKRFETVPGGLIAYDGAGAVTLRFVPGEAPKR